MTKTVVPKYSHLSQAEMEVGLEVARVGNGRVDYLRDSITLDGLAAEMFGFPAGKEIDRATFHNRIHPEDWDLVSNEVDRLLAPEDPDVIDLTHRVLLPDGRTRWVNARKRVTFDHETSTARPVSGVFAVVDVTDAKLAQQHTQLLIGELNHRSKNLITVVDGISRLLARTVPPEEFPEKLSERLSALSRNQDAMVHGNGTEFDMPTLVRSQLAPFDENLKSRVDINGPSLRVQPAAAQVLGMIVHELATNAVKHGALSNPEGRVTVMWSGGSGDALSTMCWKEQGGPQVSAPSRNGFGSQVLETLPRLSLDAQVSVNYEPDGFHYDLRLP